MSRRAWNEMSCVLHIVLKVSFFLVKTTEFCVIDFWKEDDMQKLLPQEGVTKQEMTRKHYDRGKIDELYLEDTRAEV